MTSATRDPRRPRGRPSCRRRGSRRLSRRSPAPLSAGIAGGGRRCWTCAAPRSPHRRDRHRAARPRRARRDPWAPPAERPATAGDQALLGTNSLNRADRCGWGARRSAQRLDARADGRGPDAPSRPARPSSTAAWPRGSSARLPRTPAERAAGRVPGPERPRERGPHAARLRARDEGDRTAALPVAEDDPQPRGERAGEVRGPTAHRRSRTRARRASLGLGRTGLAA